MRNWLKSSNCRIVILLIWFIVGIMTLVTNLVTAWTYIPLFISFVLEYGINTMNKIEEEKLTNV